MFENASSYVDKNEIIKFLKVSKNQELFKKWKKIDSIKFLDQMMAIDYKLFMCDEVFVKVDKATMSASLEGREPLIDHRIIEYMARVPLDIKYKNKQGKYLLRQVLYKYLPKEMVDKPKSGFQIPLDEWLKTDLKNLLDKYINTNKLSDKIFNVNLIMENKENFLNGKNNGNLIWLILIYQIWYEKWMEN